MVLFVTRFQVVGKAVFRQSALTAQPFHFGPHFRHEGKELVIGIDAFLHGCNDDGRDFPDEYRCIQSFCRTVQISVDDGNLGCQLGNFPEKSDLL